MDDITKAPYRPQQLHPDERKTPEVTPSIDAPISARDTEIAPGSFHAYHADVKSLRVLAPYIQELSSRLGSSCFVLEFTSKFSYDSIPNEYRHKDKPLLLRVDMPGVSAWLTDSDLKTFFFSTEDDAKSFITLVDKGVGPSPSSEETLEKRENLRKLLW